jgi:hypothetical protein
MAVILSFDVFLMPKNYERHVMHIHKKVTKRGIFSHTLFSLFGQ